MKASRLFFLLMILGLYTAESNAQNIGINTTGVAPAASSILDLVSADKGLLVPRVVLTATNVAGPITAPATSLLVYNTNTAGAAPTNVTPGYYYWDGAQWVRLLGAGNAWQLTGNVLTGVEFMGSTNSQPVRFYSNNLERMRINPVDGEVIVGATTSGLPGDMLCAVGSAAVPWAVNGYTSQNGGGVYGRSTGATAYSAIEGNYAGSGGGAAVLAGNAGTSVSNVRAGLVGQCITTVAASGGAGVSGWNGVGTLNQHMGTLGQYNGAAYGIGAYGVGFGGGLIAGNFDIGVVGWVANGLSYSGYFNGNHVIANGTKSASVGTSQGNQLLYVTETPEVWFEDIGRATLVNGSVQVDLDPLFLETVFIDGTHPMHVFIQMEGESNDVYTVPGTTSFQVKERNGGTSNAAFSYRIMAKRINFQDHRFGNDPVWGPGDTRAFMQYAPAPKLNYVDQLKFMEEQRRNWKQTPMPAGFVPYEELQSEMKAVQTRRTGE